MAKKYYVVWKGRKTGIFDSWEECRQAVEGYPDAKYKSFKSLAAAELASKQSPEDFKNKKNKFYSLFDQKPILESIAVDAAYSSKSEIVEYQGVYVKNGKKLFYDKIGKGTNNIGEFLAIVHALYYLTQKKINIPIYSDSLIAIKWIKNKKCKTEFDFKKNPKLLERIKQAEKWLQNIDLSKYKILKWNTELWGEIPADFGNK